VTEQHAGHEGLCSCGGNWSCTYCGASWQVWPCPDCGDTRENKILRSIVSTHSPGCPYYTKAKDGFPRTEGIRFVEV
jgi:hypothetical protein